MMAVVLGPGRVSGLSLFSPSHCGRGRTGHQLGGDRCRRRERHTLNLGQTRRSAGVPEPAAGSTYLGIPKLRAANSP